MKMREYAGLAALGSAALLLGALGFQYLGDLPPCKLCIWQRWPHVAAILIGAAVFIKPLRPLVLLGALAALTTAAIGGYHAGVELAWWEGPNTCTSGDITDMSINDLMAQILAAPVVRCDEVAWSLLGLSMAAWNGVISLGLAGLWMFAWRRGELA